MKAVQLLFFAGIGAASLHAQADLFKKPPEDVDQALRARLNKFYQSYVDGKTRAALALVAEDTKDLWFDSDKPKYKSFEVVKISYSDDFKQASVVILAEQMLKQRMGEFLMRVPIAHTWRLDDGQWFYYVAASARGVKESPFGLLKAGPGEGGGLVGAQRADLSKVFAGVWLNKSNVRLGGTDEVTITNDLPGSVHLTLELDKFEGLSAKLERSELGARENTKVVFSFKGNTNGTATLQARVVIAETNQAFPVTIKLD